MASPAQRIQNKPLEPEWFQEESSVMKNEARCPTELLFKTIVLTAKYNDPKLLDDSLKRKDTSSIVWKQAMQACVVANERNALKFLSSHDALRPSFQAIPALYEAVNKADKKVKMDDLCGIQELMQHLSLDEVVEKAERTQDLADHETRGSSPPDSFPYLSLLPELQTQVETACDEPTRMCLHLACKSLYYSPQSPRMSHPMFAEAAMKAGNKDQVAFGLEMGIPARLFTQWLQDAASCNQKNIATLPIFSQALPAPKKEEIKSFLLNCMRTSNFTELKKVPVHLLREMFKRNRLECWGLAFGSCNLESVAYLIEKLSGLARPNKWEIWQLIGKNPDPHVYDLIVNTHTKPADRIKAYEFAYESAIRHDNIALLNHLPALQQDVGHLLSIAVEGRAWTAFDLLRTGFSWNPTRILLIRELPFVRQQLDRAWLGDVIEQLNRRKLHFTLQDLAPFTHLASLDLIKQFVKNSMHIDYFKLLVRTKEYGKYEMIEWLVDNLGTDVLALQAGSCILFSYETTDALRRRMLARLNREEKCTLIDQLILCQNQIVEDTPIPPNTGYLDWFKSKHYPKLQSVANWQRFQSIVCLLEEGESEPILNATHLAKILVARIPNYELVKEMIRKGIQLELHHLQNAWTSQNIRNISRLDRIIEITYHFPNFHFSENQIGYAIIEEEYTLHVSRQTILKKMAEAGLPLPS